MSLSVLFFLAIVGIIYSIYLVVKPLQALKRERDRELTVDDIPNRNVQLDLYMISGTVTDVKKNMSHNCEVREIWLKDSKSVEHSVTIYGNVPVRRGHFFSAVYDRITGAVCGAINHETNTHFNLVPGIESNRFAAPFLRNRRFFERDESMISAWGDQNIHVLPRVEQFLLQHKSLPKNSGDSILN